MRLRLCAYSSPRMIAMAGKSISPFLPPPLFGWFLSALQGSSESTLWTRTWVGCPCRSRPPSQKGVLQRADIRQIYVVRVQLTLARESATLVDDAETPCYTIGKFHFPRQLPFFGKLSGSTPERYHVLVGVAPSATGWLKISVSVRRARNKLNLN